MAYKNLVLLSGGLDSMVVAYSLKKMGEEAILMHFSLDGTGDVELSTARAIADDLGFPLEVISLVGVIDSFLRVIPRSALEMDFNRQTPSSTFPLGRTSGFPILLAIATHHARLRKIPYLWLGIEKDQLDANHGLRSFCSGWPLLMFAFDAEASAVEVKTPLLEMSKRDVLLKGIELGAPVHLSRSCHNAGELHCGKCSGCNRRKEAYLQAEVSDPTLYAEEKAGDVIKTPLSATARSRLGATAA